MYGMEWMEWYVLQWVSQQVVIGAGRYSEWISKWLLSLVNILSESASCY